MDSTPSGPSGLFASTVAHLHRGDLLDSLDCALDEVVQAVQGTGKKGKLTLTLSVGVAVAGGDQIVVEATYQESVPKAARAPSIFYAHGHQLVREDPKQTRLDLRSVEEPADTLREVE